MNQNSIQNTKEQKRFMKKQQHCGICAWMKVFLENEIINEKLEKDKMIELGKVALESKHHYKMRAYEKTLDEIRYAERKLK